VGRGCRCVSDYVAIFSSSKSMKKNMQKMVEFIF
jgi:hypothetical protein